MFCHNCGQRINDGEKFCTRCGAMALYKDRTAREVTPVEDKPLETVNEVEAPEVSYAEEIEMMSSDHEEAVTPEDDAKQSDELTEVEDIMQKAVSFDSIRNEASEEGMYAEIENEPSQKTKILNEYPHHRDDVPAYSPEKEESVGDKKPALGASRLDKPLTTWGFMWRMLVCSIPIVGIVFLFVFAFASGINRNSKHFASAMIILNLIAISIFIGGMVFIFASGYNRVIVEWLNAASMLPVG